MATINIGTKIRELRKKKGITQEMLASVLSISPQAISKWESGLTYPDMAMMPIIAGYFEVSMDMLFDYDVQEMKSKIKKIIDDAFVYYFDDTPKYIAMIKSALQEYPSNEMLLTALLDGHEYSMRELNDTSHLDETIELSQKIIAESTDFIRVCNVKDILACAYLKKGDYDRAKEILMSLPHEYDIRDSAIHFRLSGKDKLNSAVNSKKTNLQNLYIACFEEGNAWFFMPEDTEFENYTSDDFIPNALKSYEKGLSVLTSFMLTENEDPTEQYLWAGMQTFHWGFLQKIGACHKKLGNIKECDKYVTEAYKIISTTWKDFEENKKYYMEPFNEYLEQVDLKEYIKKI